MFINIAKMMTHQVYGEIMSPFKLDTILIDVSFCILSFLKFGQPLEMTHQGTIDV